MSISFHNSVLLPNILNFEKTGDNSSRLTIEPCYPGYGVTIANALRRVLLSSLPGSAVIAAKFEGVQHEFSAIPGVKEDVVDIILNIKKLKFKSYTPEPVKVYIKAKGAKVITGADIETTNDVEIVNPDHVIATLTDKSSALTVELTVATGLGFVPVEAREKEKLTIGEIAMDAWFSPVIRVGFNNEHVRVGKMVNFDKIVMDIETDGSISPEDAVKQAATILVDHFNLFTGAGQKAEVSVDSTDATDVLVENQEDQEADAKPKRKKASK